MSAAAHPIHPLLAPLAQLAKQVCSTPSAQCRDALAAGMRRTIAAKDGWLRPEHRIGDPTAYMRHLLYTDADGDFVITVITWLPGQQSPVHGHRVWCAFGVVEGELTEEQFTVAAGASPVLATSANLRAGELAAQDFDGKAAHRVANRGNATLVSLHLYGVSGERLTTGINRIYA